MPSKPKYRKKSGHKSKYKNINKTIDVNDVLDELREENNRLLNDLLFANNCLIIFSEFKSFVDFISIKFKENLDSNELKKFRELSERVNQTIRTTNIDITTIKSEINEEFGEQEVRDTNGESLRSFRLQKRKRVDPTNQTISIEEVNNHDNFEAQNRVDTLNDEFFDSILQQKSDDDQDDIGPYFEDDFDYNLFNEELEEVSDNEECLNETKDTKKKRRSEFEVSDDDYCPSDGPPVEGLWMKRKKRKKYGCPHYNICRKSYPSQKKLKEHLDNSHSERRDFECNEPDCEYRTYSRQQLKDHFIAKHTDQRPFSCPVDGCEKACKTANHLQIHLKTHSKPKNICEDCRREFRRVSELQRHIRSVHTIKVPNEYRCEHPSCEFRTTRIKNLRRHMQSKHKRRYKCDFDKCDKEFSSEILFRRHREVFHLNRTRIPCPHPGCEFQAYHEYHIKSHLVIHSSERRFKCDFMGCDKKFKRLQTLIKHKRGHTDQKREFKCRFEGCDKAYVNSHSLKKHLANVHLKEQEYRCEWPGCDFKTYHEDSLKRHMQSTHCEYTYTCDYPGCGKKFKTGSHAVKHKQQVHDRVRDQACSWPGCHYMAFSKHLLERHVMSHTKEKPFVCEWPGCGYSSSQKVNVKVHVTKMHYNL